MYITRYKKFLKGETSKWFCDIHLHEFLIVLKDYKSFQCKYRFYCRKCKAMKYA